MDFFLLGIAFLFVHELDAVRCKEWRIFPGLSLLNDRWGLSIFLFAHVPLFYWILSEAVTRNEKFVHGFDIFLIVHLVLHVLFLRHSKNEFTDTLSWSIIIAAALCGLIDLTF